MKFEKNELNLMRFCSNEMGINYKTLKNKVIEILKNEQGMKERALKHVKNITELTLEEVKQLRKEIVLNSLFISDYANSFGINPSMLCDIMNGYCEEIETKIEENGGKFKDFDNGETLFEYINGIEWDAEYLEDLTKERKKEIEEEFNIKEAIFYQEYIYAIASNLQHEIIQEINIESELEPFFDKAISFYKKAYILKNKNVITLKSYNTKILEYNITTEKLKFLTTNKNHFSQTTNRHINEFLKQYTRETPKSKNELIKLAKAK